jgi:putative FmdB family regulatory protein
MPLYEYLCEACGRRTESLQRVDDPPLAACPHCQGKLRKLVSAPAFQFKGSGWYLTDYARKPAGGGKDGESAPAGKGAEPAAGGGEGSAKPTGETAPAAAPKPSSGGGD